MQYSRIKLCFLLDRIFMFDTPSDYSILLFVFFSVLGQFPFKWHCTIPAVRVKPVTATNPSAVCPVRPSDYDLDQDAGYFIHIWVVHQIRCCNISAWTNIDPLSMRTVEMHFYDISIKRENAYEKSSANCTILGGRQLNPCCRGITSQERHFS